MGIEQLVLQAEKWTPSMIAGLAAFIVSYFMVKIKKNSDEDVKREEKLALLFESGLNQLASNFKATIEKLEKQIADQYCAIEALKMDKLEKTDWYQDSGGWRTEINRLQDLIIKQYSESMHKIIELWKESAHGKS